MVRKYHRKSQRGSTYTNEDLQSALDHLKSGSLTVFRASKVYKIPRSTLTDHLKGRRGQKSSSFGRAPALLPLEEQKLANSLKCMEKWGFGLSRTEILNVVGEYVNQNKITTPFKDGIPGQDWFLNFKQRHSLSIKKPEQVEYLRKKNEEVPGPSGIVTGVERSAYSHIQLRKKKKNSVSSESDTNCNEEVEYEESDKDEFYSDDEMNPLDITKDTSDRKKDAAKDGSPKNYFKIVDINSILQNPLNDVNSNNVQSNSYDLPVNFITHRDHHAQYSTIPTPKVSKVQKPPYRCFAFTRKPYKLDLEGFTSFDRLGFRLCETTRAKRCMRALSGCIKELEKITSRLKHSCGYSEENLTEPKTVGFTKGKKMRNNKRNTTKCRKSDVNISNVSDNSKIKDINFPSPICKTYSYTELVKSTQLNLNTYFVDYNNVKDIDGIKERDPSSNIYFINKDDIVTTLYMNSIPSIRDKVIVIDQKVYDKYMRLHNKEIETPKKTQRKKNRSNSRLIAAKQKIFLDIVSKFHAEFRSSIK